MTTQSAFLRLACIFGGLSVVLGAFGAHALKSRLDPDMLQIFETGVRYQFYHALAMLAFAAGIARLWESRYAPAACTAWAVGIVIFSGSLYLLTLTGQRWLGAITPIGGVAFILGWVLAILAAGKLPH